MSAAVVKRTWASRSRSVKEFATIVGLSFDAPGGRALPFSSANDRMKIGRMIRATDERPGGDVEKTFLARNIAVIIELIGRDVLDHGQVFRGRAQILAQG